MELEDDSNRSSSFHRDTENSESRGKDNVGVRAVSKDSRSRSNGELSTVRSADIIRELNGRAASLGTNDRTNSTSDIHNIDSPGHSSRPHNRRCDLECSRDVPQNTEEPPGSARDTTFQRSSSCEENCHVPRNRTNNVSSDQPVTDCDSNNMESERVCSKYKSCQRDTFSTENNLSFDPAQSSTSSESPKVFHKSRTPRKSSGLSKTCGLLGACAMLGSCANREITESPGYVQQSEPCASSGSSEALEISRTSLKNNSGTGDNSEKEMEPDNSIPKPDNRNATDVSSDNETDESSSDMGNDELSIGSEDSLLYNYRSQWLVDIPNLDGLASGESGSSRPNNSLPGFGRLNLQAIQVPGSGAPGFVVAGDVQEGNAAVAGSGHTSPDMDFLEMDFDPGPSYADSSHSSLDVEVDESEAPLPHQEIPHDGSNCRQSQRTRQSPSSSTQFPPPYQDVRIVRSNEHYHSSLHTFAIPLPYQTLSSMEVASGSGHRDFRESRPHEKKVTKENTRRESSPLLAHRNSAGEVIYVRRTTFQPAVTPSVYHHSSSGDVVAPDDLVKGEVAGGVMSTQSGSLAPDSLNLASSYYHASMAKILMVDDPESKFSENKGTSNVECSTSKQEAEPVGRHMLWSEQEASERQVTQIGASACGATAVINALSALSVSVEASVVSAAIGTRLRANTAPLPRYLLSRSVAGCTADQLLRGLSQAGVSARFFATFPERVVSLSHWLAYWISLGAVPILTLNLQAGVWNCYQAVADAWHHQMVFGVSPRGVYLANPLQCVSEGVLWHQLVSDSVLLVRSRDLTSRWDPDTDLNPLVRVPGDDRWRTMNVLGQVVNVLREFVTNPMLDGSTRTQHISIPAAYRAGVTIATITGSEAHRRLVKAPELPIRRPN